MTTSREDSFRHAMKSRRNSLGWSQEDLADALGDEWTQTKVHEIEREKAPRRIKLDEAQAIADALHLPLESMLGIGPLSTWSTENLVERLAADRRLSRAVENGLVNMNREIREQIDTVQEAYLQLGQINERIVSAATELYGRGELSGEEFSDGEHQEET